MNHKRLYIFTGKGGVGKTALSLSFCKYLQSINKKALLIHFDTGGITDKKSNQTKKPDILETKARELNIPIQKLGLIESATEYVGKKLKSETIAKWVLKTPFYKALVNMMPGFSYLIYLGRVLEMLKQDPDLTIIIDSPSSGHAITMLEATHNFSEIFSNGLLFDDTQKMIKTMFEPGFLQVNIITLPTMMAVNEASDLESSIKNISNMLTKIICNNSFHKMEGIKGMNLPDFLSKKIQNEEEVINSAGDKVACFVDHVPNTDMAVVATQVIPSMVNLV